MPLERDIWEEIEARLRGDFDDDEDEMAARSTKQTGWLQALIVGVVVAVLSSGINRWSSKDDENGVKLTTVLTKVEFLQEQQRLFAQRPYITREEYERELARLNARIEQIERRLESRAANQSIGPRQP